MRFLIKILFFYNMAEDNSKMLEKYRELLQKSPTAYSAGTTPTQKDVYLQRQAFKLSKAEDMSEAQRLKEQWYTERSPGADSKDEKGAIGKLLHAMLTPGYAVTGAIETALGKGSQKGLVKNIKANIEEEGCYDNQTEILTVDGWKFFKDVTKKDSVATLNPKTDELEYQSPTMIVKYNDRKELVRIKNRTLDIAVTLNHNMYVSALTTAKDKKPVYRPYKMIKAGELPNTMLKIKRNCKWKAKDKNKYPKNWFALMGLYLSEGCMANHGTAIYLSVHKEEIFRKTRKMLDESEFKYSLRKGGGFDVFVGKERAKVFKKFGTASKKYVPDYIKFSSSKNIKIFLEWFGYGDAHEKNGAREFYSCSERLINDLQECLIKIGRSGNINIRDRRGRKIWIKDHWANCNHLAYELNERVKKTESYIAGAKDIFIEKYSGVVYCVEVPNHILMVRRNGKAYFCGNTMGDLLRSTGMSNYVAMPLGLALDIAVDPVAWLTLGTSAIVPRTAIGAMKAAKTGGSALKGARLGAESSLLGKAAWTGKAASAVGKKFGVTSESKGLSRFANLQKTISERAAKTSGQYDLLVGEGVESIVKHSQRKRFLDKVSDKLEKSDFGTGVKNLLEYSSKKQWFGSLKASDEAAELATKSKEVFGKNLDDAKDIFFKKDISKKEISSMEIASKLKDEKKAADTLAEQIAEELNNIKYLLDDNPEALKKLSGMGDTELKEVAKLVRHYKINVDKYDKHVAKILLGPKARKAFNSYAIYTGLFKNMKIGLNVATRINAIVGNTAMTAMAGIDIASSGMTKSLKGAVKMVAGKDYKNLQPFIKNDGFYGAIKKYPEPWEAVTGIKADIILKGRSYIDEIANDIMKSGKLKNTDVEAVKKSFDEAVDTFVSGHQVAPGIRTTTTVRTTAGAPEGTFFSAEFMTGPYAEWLEKLKISKNPAARLFHKTATVSMETYNQIDQTFRIAQVMNLGVEGISRRELKLLSNRFVLGMKDVTKVGEKYKLSPLKSLEIAQATYMNYAAMPAFVKSMRTLPLVGHPFACRSEDTEILTENGWKKYYEIKVGEKALSLDIKNKSLEWEKIKKISLYRINENIISFQHRSVDILATLNHDVLVAKRTRMELPKENGKRKRYFGDWVIKKSKAENINDLSSETNIVCGAENGYCGNNKKTISDDLVELFGWFITEGYYTYKKVNGDFSSFSIPQSKPEGVKRLYELRKRLGVKTNIRIVKKEDVEMANYDCHIFHFPAKFLRIFEGYADGKYLTVKFLNLLTKKQLRLLFDIMILADGHSDKKGKRKIFTQNDNPTLNNFQVLCLMLGYTSTICRKPDSRNCYNATVNKKIYRQIKRNKTEEINYKGIVWCPEVKKNNNWVARRNGKVDITGNSFAYGMTGIAAETALYNPMFYNKISYLLHEISGQKSPLEKQALESGYYQWLQKPGMMKVPFFEENPIYLNTANMIPHYTMNLLQPPERDYKSRFGSQLASLIDKTPFFKTPDGQVMLDYVIMPTILQGERPQGMFGQPLWEKDAGLLKKAGYATRALAESALPPVLGYAGLGVKAGVPPEGALPYLPHYRMRQLGYATKGKSSLGIEGKEPASEKTARVMAAMAGVPYYPVKLQYSAPKGE